MPDKLDSHLFLEGRNAYIHRKPMFEVFERASEIDEIIRERGRTAKPEERQDPQLCATSYVLGFIDGALADLRDLASRARKA